MRQSGLLLDTCAVIWLFGGAELSTESRTATADAAARSKLYISAISAWEIGMLVAKNRIALSMPTTAWIDRALSFPGVRLADMTPQLLVESSFLPRQPPADPADRIIISTARQNALTIVTRDSLILAYARNGHVGAMEC